MFLYFFLIIENFNIYFPSFTPISIINYSLRYSIINENLYIKYCNFLFLSSTESGGAISISTNNIIRFLIEYCYFYSCYSSISSGSIHFSCSTSGSCILNYLCNYNCTSLTSAYHEGSQSILVYTKSTEKCFLNFISITQTINPQYRNTIYIRGGIIEINSMNSSNNYLIYDTGFFVVTDYSLRGKFNSIISNIQYHTICIRFELGSNSSIEYSNIINNSEINSYYANIIQYPSGETNLYSNIFMNNKGNLFYVSGILKIINCYYPSNSIIHSANIINYLGITNSYKLIHFCFNNQHNFSKNKFKKLKFIFIIFLTILQS